MSQILKTQVSFAQCEEKDHDAVFRYFSDGNLIYAPVQLKEWVPDFLNPHATLQQELDKLAKYADAQDLTVGVHLNRNTTIHLSELRLPHGRIGELWFYGASDPSQERWLLLGNLLSPNARAFEFSYPAA